MCRDAEDALVWLSNLVNSGRGAVLFGLTDSGDIGMWYPAESEHPMATGVEILEVITACSRTPTAADLDDKNNLVGVG